SIEGNLLSSSAIAIFKETKFSDLSKIDLAKDILKREYIKKQVKNKRGLDEAINVNYNLIAAKPRQKNFTATYTEQNP
ncbi:3263_t:CDS:2, partial [Racocetra persica]